MTIEVLRRISLKRAIALITEDDPEIRRQIVKALRVIYDATDGVFLGYGRTRMTFLDPGKDVVWKVTAGWSHMTSGTTGLGTGPESSSVNRGNHRTTWSSFFSTLPLTIASALAM